MATLVDALSRGAVIATATESSFGLLADAQNPRAVQRLFSLKPRSTAMGAPLIVPDIAVWETLVREVPTPARRLAEALWPCALSIVLPARDTVDPRLLVGGTVAVRVPGPSPALDLVRAFGGPLTATSANPTGEPPALTAEQARRAFHEVNEEFIVTPESAPGGKPSTLIRFDNNGWQILRGGAVPESTLRPLLERESPKP